MMNDSLRWNDASVLMWDTEDDNIFRCSDRKEPVVKLNNGIESVRKDFVDRIDDFEKEPVQIEEVTKEPVHIKRAGTEPAEIQLNQVKQKNEIIAVEPVRNGLVGMEPVAGGNYVSTGSKRVRLNKSMRMRLQRDRASRPFKPLPKEFDCVLVDAECTHDGALQHMKRRDGANFVFDNDRRGEYSDVCELQKGLILSGFKRLRIGGSLVYSTCSFCVAQNEEIVQWLMESEHKDVLPILCPIDTTDIPAIQSPTLPGAIRFEPQTSNTSGLFIARLTKQYKPVI